MPTLKLISLSAPCENLGDKVPVNEKARSEALIEETRKAVKDAATTKERFQQLASDLQQASQMIATAAYRQAGAESGPGADYRQSGGHGGEAGPRRDGGENVIDAEFTEH